MLQLRIESIIRYLIPMPFFLSFNNSQSFRHSVKGKDVEIRFLRPEVIEIPPAPTTICSIDSAQCLNDEELEETRKYLNRIIKAFRLVTGTIYNNGIIKPIPFDQFGKTILFGELAADGTLKNPQTRQFIKSLAICTIDDNAFTQIKEISDTTEKIDESIIQEHLLESNRFMQEEDYRFALVTAVTALDIALSRIVEEFAIKKEMSKKTISGFLVEKGITSTLNVLLRMLYFDSLPDENVMEKCKGAITIRHAIVHKGRLDVSEKEAQEAITNISEFIKHFKLAQD